MFCVTKKNLRRPLPQGVEAPQPDPGSAPGTSLRTFPHHKLHTRRLIAAHDAQGQTTSHRLSGETKINTSDNHDKIGHHHELQRPRFAALHTCDVLCVDMVHDSEFTSYVSREVTVPFSFNGFVSATQRRDNPRETVTRSQHLRI